MIRRFIDGIEFNEKEFGWVMKKIEKELNEHKVDYTPEKLEKLVTGTLIEKIDEYLSNEADKIGRQIVFDLTKAR